MKRRNASFPGTRVLARLFRDESGTTLVEFAIALATFLLIFFGLIDFGRLGYSVVMADKAMQRAARIAAVRPPVCSGVPETNSRNSAASVTPEFGTSCSVEDGSGNSVCAASTVTCAGDEAATTAATATAAEIWAAIQGLMPPGATIADIRFTYTSDPDLGFLGGPYVPVASTELAGLTFQFVSPLGGLARMAGAVDASDMDVTFPPMSVSLPGEDLNQGTSG